MVSRIGADLRRARERRGVELAEVEARTQIRVRFLEAIEREEWEALPGGAYTRAFIRTYGSFLGLDGERLAEDFRRQVEGQRPGPGEPGPTPLATATAPRRAPRSPRLRWLAVPAVLALGALAALALPDGPGGGAPEPVPRTAGEAARDTGPAAQPVTEPRPGLSLSIEARAEVWVCLLDGRGRPLVEGRILAAGEREGPFRSGSFTVSLGNGEVTMSIDGAPADISATPNPVGYAVGPSGALTELPEAERPICT